MGDELGAAGHGMKGADWALAVACCAVLACAITGSTLWIDEGFSAWVAAHRSAGDVVRTLMAGDASDRQMPLHYFWLWGWTSAFGRSEVALRSANLPFVVLYVCSLMLTARLAFRRRIVWIPLSLSPFAWFYVNEARAYFMLIALSAAATGALMVYTFGEERIRRRAAWVFGIAMLGAWLTHLLAAFVAPAAAVLLIHAARSGRVKAAHWRWPAVVLGPAFAVVGVFYATTLFRGTTYEYGGPSPAHFAMALYEHAGLGGMGPPRNLIRSLSLDVFGPYLAPLGLGVAGLLYCAVSALGSGIDRRARLLCAAWAGSFALAIAVAYVVNSRFLGRHVAALLPLLLFAAMGCLRRKRQLVVLGLLWLAADARYRFVADYDKDDYRAAVGDVVGRAKQSEGAIAWAADPLTANYYGLALQDWDRGHYYEFDYSSGMRKVDYGTSATGVIVENWHADAVERFVKGQRGQFYLALSKPDLYDAHGGWRRWIANSGAGPVARYRTFEIYALRGSGAL